jgi:general secretion pathway protein F
MAVYEYKAMDARGKKLQGLVDADSPKAARQKLRREGTFVTEIVEGKAGGTVRSAGGASTAKKTGGIGNIEIDLSKYLEVIGVADVANATRQLSALIGAGIPLVEALGALSEQVDKENFRIILREIKTKVNEGSSLAKALADYPRVFSPLFVNMVRAGEQAGALESVLERLADYTEAQVELRGKVGAALTYPAVMLLVALGVIGFLLTYVVPKITKVFKDMGNELPTITKVVLWVSNTLQNYWWLVILIGVVSAVLFRRWYRTESGRLRVDAWSLKMPIFGSMFRLVSIARFASTLSTLMTSGVPLLAALGIVKNVMSNVVLANAVADAQEAVREGSAVHQPLKKSGEFPPMVVHMIAVGERTGELSSMLERVAKTYESQVNRRVETLTALLEPLMILFMGGIVFVIALAVLLPMLQMNRIAGG